MFGEEEKEPVYTLLKYFPHKNYQYSDYIDDKSTLRFTTHIPMGAREWEVYFSNDNISDFFEHYNKLIFNLWREDDNLFFRISLGVEDKYQNMDIE